MSRLFGDVHQLGHVVPDLDRALGDWVGAGVGPWEVIRDFPVDEWWVGEASSEIHVDVALSYSGEMQIELICQLNDAPSMYQQFLSRAPGGGFQHLGYRCADYERAVGLGEEAGYTVWMHGLVSGSPFAYLRPPVGSGAPVVELSRGSESGRRRNEQLAERCRRWDGSNPVSVRQI